ncbi:beta-N-acetylglucosaminidase domain-containing protein [Georgenia satyanarayanai]|uniref:beta-N-acetylhexosaminidase family protein n=1 Tax=Georgenia satyanarayanai TaxID=860221 RepID=UPI00203EC806|nr:beta-N-acetylglucosaminidase domain-containing protein [Georgenia satyanarayanai]MCM3660171.1 beta-N-acetylglucosaminidase domain-containing protein [Georgenia satyanarayanai]
MRHPVLASGVTLALAAGAVALPSSTSPAAAALPDPLLVPAPVEATYTGESVPVDDVTVVTDETTDAAALAALLDALDAYGVEDVTVLEPGQEPAGFAVAVVGADAVEDEGVPEQAEGYALVSDADGALVVGRDGAGQFYGVQTLVQLLDEVNGDTELREAAVIDYPAMALRGTIEGFYGEPWTHAERLDHLDFLGSVKANTYVYAPKDDPYHRDQWREPYPEDTLAELTELIARADENHVQFTFAVSPGVSICYSDPEHRADLEAKLDAIYDAGGRSFYIALDDIAYTDWNCEADAEAYGPAGQAAAAAAQVDLLNDVQQTWVAEREGVRPLQMVPTEYGDLKATAYKDVIRETLDPAVVIQWTGTDVVPTSITTEDAERFSELYGRPAFLWDNYPVNDFGDTAGRLLLGPYAYRDNGLSEHLTGIVSNPMNQPYASEVVVASVADFAWNDATFDAEESWLRSLALLAGGDADVTAALAVFADLNRQAPTFGAEPWQPQAPGLTALAEEFRTTWEEGDTDGALDLLSAYAELLAVVPELITDGVHDGFLADAARWLESTELWADALRDAIASVDARLAGDAEAGEELAARASEGASAAADVRVDPLRNRWPADSRVKVGDGVLDVLIEDLLALEVSVPEPTEPPTDGPSPEPTDATPVPTDDAPGTGSGEATDDASAAPGGSLPSTGAGGVAGYVALAAVLAALGGGLLLRRRTAGA